MSKLKPSTNNTKATTVLQHRQLAQGYMLTNPTNREQRRLLAKANKAKK
jgi:hypothetical protein